MKIDRVAVFNKCNTRCGYCGDVLEFKAMQVDHIIPQIDFTKHVNKQYKIPHFLTHLKETDVNHFDNLMPACRVCNKWKSAHSLELFKSELEAQVSRLNLRSANYRIAKKFCMVEEKLTKITFYFETL